MFVMSASPVIIGCERQDTEDATGPVIQTSSTEERTMPTVVLQHEETQQKACGGDDQDEACPVSELQRDRRAGPQQNERDQRHAELVQASSQPGLTVAGNDLQPS